MIFVPTILLEELSNENWRQAINVEMEVLEMNRTLELVKLLERKKHVGFK